MDTLLKLLIAVPLLPVRCIIVAPHPGLSKSKLPCFVLLTAAFIFKAGRRWEAVEVGVAVSSRDLPLRDAGAAGLKFMSILVRMLVRMLLSSSTMLIFPPRYR